MEKTRVGKTESESITGYMIKVKELNEENGDLNLKVKRLQTSHSEAISEKDIKIRRLE